MRSRRRRLLAVPVVLLTVVTTTAWGALSPPKVGPPHPVSDPVFGSATDDQSAPGLASNGTITLAVWNDQRDGGPYAARFDLGGNLLDPVGFAMDADGTWEVLSAPGPDVVWDGSRFFVVWMEGSIDHSDIYGAWITAAGEVQPPGGFPIATATREQTYPAVAWSGREYLVTWLDCRHDGLCAREDNGVYATRVTPDGEVLDPEGIPIDVGLDKEQSPEVEWTGRQFLVAWGDPTLGLLATRVSRDGTVIDPGGFLVADGTPGDVVFNGALSLVVSSNAGAIYGTRISARGEVLDTDPVLISDTDESLLYPRATWSGGRFLVTWTESIAGGPRGTRMTASGQVLDPAGIDIGVGGSHAAVTWDGSSFVVAWEQGGYPSDVFGARVSPGGVVRDPDPIEIARSASEQFGRSVAWDGSQYLVLWEDERTDYGIYAARLTAQGESLDGAGILVTDKMYYGFPYVAFGGGVFLIAWIGPDNDVMATRLDQNGTILDPDGILVAHANGLQHYVDVVWGGNQFLLVWEDSRGPDDDIYGARVSPAGQVVDPNGFPISAEPNRQETPGVGWNGESFIVVWDELHNIYAARVTGAGEVLDPEGIAVAIAPKEQSSPLVAGGPDTSLVVWHDLRASSEGDVFGARIDASGAVLDADGISISTATAPEGNPRVAWDGTTFLVAWTKGVDYVDWDVAGARVGADGDLIDPRGFDIASTDNDEFVGALIPGPAGRVATLFSRFTPAAYGTYRAFLSFIDEA